MKKNKFKTVHLTLEHERSLCGLHPFNGVYDIRRVDAFVDVVAGQCRRCLLHFKNRGYRLSNYRQGV